KDRFFQENNCLVQYGNMILLVIHGLWTYKSAIYVTKLKQIRKIQLILKLSGGLDINWRIHMNKFLSKKVIGYSLILFLILIISGAILSQIVTNLYVLLAVLVIEYIVLLLIVFHFFDKYVKPIDKAKETMDKLLKGNYHARIHQPMTGSIGELSTKINSLARSLSELTISEQIQAEQLSTVIENSESGL